MKKSVFVLAISMIAFVTTEGFAQVSDTTKKDTTKKDTTTTDTVKKGPNYSQTQSPASGSASGDVVAAISGSGYNTALAAAIKTSGVESALVNGEMYTVFAPNDKAFTENKTKTDALFKDQSAEQKVIKNHIVKGQFTKADIIKALTANKGTTTLTTIDGDKLTLKINSQSHLEISDTDGNTAEVTVFDLKGTNGVAHVVDNILLSQ